MKPPHRQRSVWLHPSSTIPFLCWWIIKLPWRWILPLLAWHSVLMQHLSQRKRLGLELLAVISLSANDEAVHQSRCEPNPPDFPKRWTFSSTRKEDNYLTAIHPCFFDDSHPYFLFPFSLIFTINLSSFPYPVSLTPHINKAITNSPNESEREKDLWVSSLQIAASVS